MPCVQHFDSCFISYIYLLSFQTHNQLSQREAAEVSSLMCHDVATAKRFYQADQGVKRLSTIKRRMIDALGREGQKKIRRPAAVCC